MVLDDLWFALRCRMGAKCVGFHNRCDGSTREDRAHESDRRATSLQRSTVRVDNGTATRFRTLRVMAKHSGNGHKTETPDVSHIRNVEVTHETSDINVRAVLTFAVVLTLATIAVSA